MPKTVVHAMEPRDRFLFWCGVAVAAAALLHLAIPIGGPDWYAFFHAPDRLVHMARTGSSYPLISCVAIAVILGVFALYAFSGAGAINRLPFLRPVLAFVAAIFVLHGIAFVPLILWYPYPLRAVCGCHSVDAFIIVTSVVLFALGVGYALGVLNAGCPPRPNST
jgi:putative oxidoreductase